MPKNRKAEYVPQSERIKITNMGTRFTLDGVRACVVGSSLPFAQVVAMDGTGRSVEFAWPTVRRIVANTGEFFS